MSILTAALQPLVLKPLAPKLTDEIRRFVVEFPRLPYGPENLESFLGEGFLATFDVWQDEKRVALAILVRTKESTTAELAIVGYRWDLLGVRFLETVLPAAMAATKKAKCVELSIVSSLGLKVSPPELQAQGFVPSHTLVSLEKRIESLPADLPTSGLTVTKLPTGKIRIEIPEKEKSTIDLYQASGFSITRRLTTFMKR